VKKIQKHFYFPILVISVLLLFIGMVREAKAAVGDEAVDSIVIRAISEVHREKFLEAVNTFKSLEPLRPETPMPYFYIAATYLSLIDEYRNPTYKPQFEAYIDSAVYFGELRSKSENQTDEDYFYYGAALGYRGIYKADIGDWFGAFKDGLRARGKLVKALEIDSTNSDVYYGLGTYDYWRSVKTKSLWWLPFISDKRKQGINEIWIAIKKGKYSPDECRYALLRIYHEEKDWDSMYNLWFNYLIKINPDDPFSYWWLADGYAQLGQWGKSEQAYKHLLKIILNSSYYHPNAEVEIRYDIAVALKNQGKKDKAITELKKAVSLKDKIIDFGKAADFLKRAENLLHRLQSEKH